LDLWVQEDLFCNRKNWMRMRNRMMKKRMTNRTMNYDYDISKLYDFSC
jgi:hypothetical protein